MAKRKEGREGGTGKETDMALAQCQLDGAGCHWLLLRTGAGLTTPGE